MQINCEGWGGGICSRWPASIKILLRLRREIRKSFAPNSFYCFVALVEVRNIYFYPRVCENMLPIPVLHGAPYKPAAPNACGGSLVFAGLTKM